MERRQENRREGKTTLLIPAMLDDHFPLLRYGFFSKRYDPVVLEDRQGVAETGLRYAHNDMCYPFILILGQYLQALASGAYDLENTALLMPTVGDACRGSNFTSLIRKALVAAGYPQVKVLSLNTKGLERDQSLVVEPGMVWRALFALYYGDLLMLLTRQVRPYEAELGAAEACRAQWTRRLAQAMETGRGLTLGTMQRTFRAVAADFAAIPRRDGEKKRVALVGELYTKYCALGNWDMAALLEEDGCEVAVNGFSWYILYYVENQIAAHTGPRRAFWRGASRFLASLQREMVAAIRGAGFHCLDPFPAFRERAWAYLNPQLQVADGWLVGGEIVGHIGSGITRILAMQPFGCLPGHVCGRGQCAALVRRFPGVRLVSVDVDASGTPSQVYNRARFLVED